MKVYVMVSVMASVRVSVRVWCKGQLESQSEGRYHCEHEGQCVSSYKDWWMGPCEGHHEGKF